MYVCIKKIYIYIYVDEYVDEYDPGSQTPSAPHGHVHHHASPVKQCWLSQRSFVSSIGETVTGTEPVGCAILAKVCSFRMIGLPPEAQMKDKIEGAESTIKESFRGCRE